MREKLYRILNRIYGILMCTSFFAGFLPVIPFIVAICIGGETGAAISNFLYKEYYPWVIVLGSVAIVVGLFGLYVAKINELSLKSFKGKDEKKN